MSFLSLGIEKNLLTQQKDYLEFQEMMYSQDYNEVTEDMSYYQELNSDADGAYDDEIAYYETLQEYYDSKKEGIESQLKVINTEIEGYEKAAQTNIKDSCKLKLSV